MHKEHFFPFRQIKIPLVHFKKDLNLTRAHPFQFLKFEWENFAVYDRSVSVPYFIYRLAFMIIFIGFFIFAVIYCDPSPSFYLIYLTNWTFTLITLYGILSFIHSLIAWIKTREELDTSIGNPELGNVGSGINVRSSAKIEPGSDQNSNRAINTSSNLMELDQNNNIVETERLNWFQAILWLTYSTTFVFCFIVTLGFWVFLYPAILKEQESSKLSEEEAYHENIIFFRHLIVHGFNAVCMCVETLVTAIPIHFTHQIYSILLGISYLLFTLIYEASSGKYPYESKNETYIYWFLDWRSHAEYVIPIPFIAIIVILVIQFLSMLLYSTRLLVVSNYFKSVDEAYRFHLYDYEQLPKSSSQQVIPPTISNSSVPPTPAKI